MRLAFSNSYSHRTLCRSSVGWLGSSRAQQPSDQSSPPQSAHQRISKLHKLLRRQINKLYRRRIRSLLHSNLHRRQISNLAAQPSAPQANQQAAPQADQQPAPQTASPADNVPADNTKMNERDRNPNEPTADRQKDNRSDRELTQQVRKAIVKDKSLSTYAHNVKVITQNGMVTLKGPVRSEEEKKAIEAKAAEVAGQDKVTNQLTSDRRIKQATKLLRRIHYGRKKYSSVWRLFELRPGGECRGLSESSGIPQHGYFRALP